jgi:dolichyl-phosphate beta-glucosyltransferase
MADSCVMSYHGYATWRSTPNDRPPTLSVVVPTYNESRRLAPTLAAIAAHVSGLGEPWELIVADSCSTDGTADMVEAVGWANTTVLRSDRRDGKGAGVARGILAARGDYVLFADADGSTPISALDHFLDLIRSDEADVVVASRAHLTDEANRSRLRRLLSDGLRLLTRATLRLGVADSQCGFKLFRRDIARRVFSRQRVTGFAFDLEALFLARSLGARIAEVPVAWVDAPGSKVEPLAEVWRFVRAMFTIRANQRRGAYARG